MLKNLEAYKPVDPYKAELDIIRAARATAMSKFEERFAAERTAELEAGQKACATLRAAQEQKPPTPAADLKKWEAPNPYEAELRVLRAAQEKR